MRLVAERMITERELAGNVREEIIDDHRVRLKREMGLALLGDLELPGDFIVSFTWEAVEDLDNCLLVLRLICVILPVNPTAGPWCGRNELFIEEAGAMFFEQRAEPAAEVAARYGMEIVKPPKDCDPWV